MSGRWLLQRHWAIHLLLGWLAGLGSALLLQGRYAPMVGLLNGCTVGWVAVFFHAGLNPCFKRWFYPVTALHLGALSIGLVLAIIVGFSD